ncbi:MAG: hypothetical protein IPK80_34445 [Nannocystis sp.]|nr:hypothetical protein [Nannocystis sp.]
MTTPPAPQTTRVALDRAPNRIATLVAAALALAGGALLVVGVRAGWGFLPLFWSGVLALAGGTALLGRLRGGGFAAAPCPRCGAPLRFTHIAAARTLRCDACGGWSSGRETMQAIADDHLADEPVFTLIAPTGPLRWPRSPSGAPLCPVCGGEARRERIVQASDPTGALVAAVAPISLRTLTTLTVPACDAHDDGVALTVVDGVVELAFRSLPYSRAFAALNPATAHPKAASAPVEAEAPPLQTLADYLATDPPDRHAIRRPLACPAHHEPIMTALGYGTTMEYLPSQEWMESASDHPCGLDIGESLDLPSAPLARARAVPQRLTFCCACVLGMAARHGGLSPASRRRLEERSGRAR